jgi:nicotinamidase-related amidase
MSRNYLHQITPYNIRHASPVREKAALLIIDMQVYFKSLCQPIVRSINSLIDCFRANNAKILFTRRGHRDPKTDGGMLARWWGDLILCGGCYRCTNRRATRGLSKKPGLWL